MKKFLGLLLFAIFVFSIYFSITNEFVSKSNDSSTFASIIPMPRPEEPPRRGC